VHVHVESTRFYTPSNLTYDQENLQPCGISITLSGRVWLLTYSLMDFQSLKISFSSLTYHLYPHTFWSWETSTV